MDAGDTQVRLPVRSRRFGVGKEIGGAVYVHRCYAHVFEPGLSEAIGHLPPGFDYTVVKFNLRSGMFSFIQSVDFDVAPEPTVGDIITVSANGKVTVRRQGADPLVYHHKWLFVADDYDGFDVEASRQRSRTWLALDGVDKTRIGRRSYWEEHVARRLADCRSG